MRELLWQELSPPAKEEPLQGLPGAVTGEQRSREPAAAQPRSPEPGPQQELPREVSHALGRWRPPPPFFTPPPRPAASPAPAAPTAAPAVAPGALPPAPAALTPRERPAAAAALTPRETQPMRTPRELMAAAACTTPRGPGVTPRCAPAVAAGPCADDGFDRMLLETAKEITSTLNGLQEEWSSWVVDKRQRSAHSTPRARPSTTPAAAHEQPKQLGSAAGFEEPLAAAPVHAHLAMPGAAVPVAPSKPRTVKRPAPNWRAPPTPMAGGSARTALQLPEEPEGPLLVATAPSLGSSPGVAASTAATLGAVAAVCASRAARRALRCVWDAWAQAAQVTALARLAGGGICAEALAITTGRAPVFAAWRRLAEVQHWRGDDPATGSSAGELPGRRRAARPCLELDLESPQIAGGTVSRAGALVSWRRLLLRAMHSTPRGASAPKGLLAAPRRAVARGGGCSGEPDGQPDGQPDERTARRQEGLPEGRPEGWRAGASSSSREPRLEGRPGSREPEREPAASAATCRGGEPGGPPSARPRRAERAPRSPPPSR